MSGRVWFKVRAQAHGQFAGWEARAKAAGLRVTAGPAAFGRISYVVRLGILAVSFESARASVSEWSAPASAQPLVAALVAAGIVEVAS